MKISLITSLVSFASESKKEPAAEGSRSIGLIGYLSVYKKSYFTENDNKNRVRAKLS